MFSNQQNRQAGVVLVFFAMSLPVLLGLVALAVDCGNLYLARARLTKIARSSSATALNMMSMRGWASLVTDSQTNTGSIDWGLKTYNAKVNPPNATIANQAVIQQVHQSTLAALSKYYGKDFNSLGTGQSPTYLKYRLPGSTETTPTVTLNSFDLTDSSVKLVIRYATPTYLLGAVSQMLGISTICEKMGTEQTNRCWVESAVPPDGKTGKMRSANVMMLLDVSGSMNEVSSSGKTKAISLFEAAAKFIDMFNPRNDRFAVIPYATTADTGLAPNLSPLDTSIGSGVVDYLPIKNTIKNFEVGGQTNQCDALIQVIRAIQNDSTLADPKNPKFVLLFTDGAPNVYRLSFCENAGGGDNSCSSTPQPLQTALGTSGADAVSPGWYGWTVKWDKREVFPLNYPTVTTCPSDGSGEVSTDGKSIPVCDPVWAFPKVVETSTNTELSYASVSQYLRLREDGEFVFKGGTTYGTAGKTLAELGYSLKFKDWLGSDLFRRDYQYPQAFKWYGPSYLVHASFRMPWGFSLIDRIPLALESGASPAITCGPGSRSPYPGALTKFSPIVADKYNHSRYFASRVVDRNWQHTGSINDDSQAKAAKTGLTQDQQQNAPAYFDKPHIIAGSTNDTPGCLSTLSAKIPFTNARVHVGDNFVSNNRNSILAFGEAVKTAELPYYCALRAADYLRTQYGVVIFVVGLGDSASAIYGTSCEDPLQNSLDPNSRKDRFLRRLAFSPESLADPITFLGRDPMEVDPNATWNSDFNFGFKTGVTFGSCNNHPLNNSAASSTANMEVGYYEDPDRPNGFSPADHQFTPSHLGAYYAANNPEELKMIFGEIAKRVLLRLAT